MAKVVIAGGTGTLGSACAANLSAAGYEVIVLSRTKRPSPYRLVQWDPGREWIEDTSDFEGAKAVINLTGKSLNAGRWTPQLKAELRSSRIEPALFLHKLIDGVSEKPTCYIGGAGIGIYGNTGPHPVHEDHPPDSNSFAGQLAIDWEAAHLAGDKNIRTVVPRISVVLDADSGFLKEMKLPTSMGIFPYFGSGDQFFSWIHIDDLAASIVWLMEHESASGPFNICAPGAVPSKEFMKDLRHAKGMPGIAAGAPKWVIDIVLGEVSDLLFAGCNASCKALEDTGYKFRYPTAIEALRDLV